MKTKQKLAAGILSLMMVVTAAPVTASAATNTPPAKVTITSVKRVSNTKTMVKWKKLKKNASGYAVYVKAGSSKWRVIKKVGKKTASITFATSPESKYQVKVRAYKNGKKVKKYYNKKTKKFVSKKAYKKLKKKNRTTKKVTTVKWGKYSIVKSINPVKKNSNTNKQNSTKPQYQAKYSYEMGNSPIQGKYKYTNNSAIIHVKSNNPNKKDPNVTIYIRSKDGRVYDGTQRDKDGDIRSDSQAVYAWNGNLITYPGAYTAGAVDDGFVDDVAGPRGSVDAGTYTVFVREYNTDNFKEYEDVEIGTINILDYENEREDYYKEIMNNITTDDMTKDEKMTAAKKWIVKNCKYPGYTTFDRDVGHYKKGDEGIYSRLTMQCLAVPFESKLLNCLDTADAIFFFGKTIDYSIEIVSVPGESHYYAVHKDKNGKVERDFDFSPPVARDNVTTNADFINWSEL